MKSRFIPVGVLLMAVATIVVVMQSWVGSRTIYSVELRAKRETMHAAILTNTPPPGGWIAYGAATTQMRVGAVYMAQGLIDLFSLSVDKAYKILDTVFLGLALVGLFYYLLAWVPPPYAAIGMLYVASILPLTYLLHAFHPWDRPQFAIWVLMLWLVHRGAVWWLCLALALSMLFKFDSVLVPGLFFLAHVRRETWRRVAAQTFLLAAVSLGIYIGLRWSFPAEPRAGSMVETISAQVIRNLGHLAEYTISHPPLLAFALPTLLCLSRVRTIPRFHQAGLALGAAMMLIWFLFSEFREVRAQMPFMLLVLPPALIALREILQPAAIAKTDLT